MHTPSVVGVVAFVMVASAAATVLPASAAGRTVTVTCDVPRSQPERQLAPNSCLNYVPDGTQTYTALVRNSSGNPVLGRPGSGRRSP